MTNDRTTKVVRARRVDLLHLQLYAKGVHGRDVTEAKAIEFAAQALSSAAVERLADAMSARAVAQQIAAVARVRPDARFLRDGDTWQIAVDDDTFVIGVAPENRVLDNLARFSTLLDGDGVATVLLGTSE